MMDTGEMTKRMETALQNIQMEINMWDNIKMIFLKIKEFTLGKMDVNTMVSLNKTKEVGKELTIIGKDPFMKVNGWMI